MTRAMELAPSNPSFLDMRNAILQADQAVYGGKRTTAIWKVFAHRGMGFFAGSLDGDDTAPVEDFSLPPEPGTPKGTLTGKVTDQRHRASRRGRRRSPSAATPPASPATRRPSPTADGQYTITGIFAGTYPRSIAAARATTRGRRTGDDRRQARTTTTN